MFEKIKNILEGGFIYIVEMARILALGFTGKKNIIVFGPGGHGKSEMTKAVIEGLGHSEETFYQFFGEGMDESRLFGGLNFRKLEEEKILEYYPEKSFLNYRVAVFEELFDAPAAVLLALKDVLTAKELRNGTQKFKMKTEIIICLTNKEPAEISDLGPAAHALIERFPLQLNLKWKSYESKNYLDLFNKVSLNGPKMNGFAAVLAEILAKATAEGNFISPRTAVHAYQICQTSAILRGATEISKQDLLDLKYLPGLEGLAETIQKDLDAAIERAATEKLILSLEKEFKEIVCTTGDTESPIKLLQGTKHLLQFADKLSNLRVPDHLIDRRKSLREATDRKVGELQRKALENTKI